MYHYGKNLLINWRTQLPFKGLNMNMLTCVKKQKLKDSLPIIHTLRATGATELFRNNVPEKSDPGVYRALVNQIFKTT